MKQKLSSKPCNFNDEGFAMQELIDKMRADWSVVAAHLVAAKEWTKEDEIEIGQAIKAAIDAKDRNAIACWSRWLADLSAWVTAWNLICRGSEAAMRAAANEHKANGNQEKGKQ
jgi:hypothetical protein